MIEVRLYATLRYGRDKVSIFAPDKFTKASEVLDYLEISYEDVSIYLINGMHAGLDAPLHDGDIIALFPPVGGG